MNLNPRLPDLPEGDPTYPISLDYMQRYRDRFYRYHRDIVQTLTPLTPVYGVSTLAATFTTPGDLTIAYSINEARWTKLGRMVFADINLITSTFTFTTSANQLVVTGLPFIATNTTGYDTANPIEYSGITKAGYHTVSARLSANSATLSFEASGSGVAQSSVTAANTPTGGTLLLRGRVTYLTDD